MVASSMIFRPYYLPETWGARDGKVMNVEGVYPNLHSICKATYWTADRKRTVKFYNDYACKNSDLSITGVNVFDVVLKKNGKVIGTVLPSGKIISSKSKFTVAYKEYRKKPVIIAEIYATRISSVIKAIYNKTNGHIVQIYDKDMDLVGAFCLYKEKDLWVVGNFPHQMYYLDKKDGHILRGDIYASMFLEKKWKMNEAVRIR